MALYCDLHAHSRKHNIFIYGCENRRGGEKRLQEQVFPLMLHKNTADKVFTFSQCVQLISIYSNISIKIYNSFQNCTEVKFYEFY